MSDYKERIRRSVEAYSLREQKKIEREYGLSKKKRRREPEEDVCRDLMGYWNSNGFNFDRNESKANKQVGTNTWVNSGLKSGTPDFIGCDPDGHYMAVEVKAPGRRNKSGLRDAQRDFLVSKIDSGAFGCVTDSVSHFEDIYLKWKNAKRTQKKSILLSDIP